MLWLVFLFSPLASAIPTIGYNPIVAGGFYPGGLQPQSSLAIPAVYPGFYAQPQVYSQQVADDSQYQGAGQAYKNYGQDARANEIVRDAGAISNRDSDARSGGHMIARGSEGAGGNYRGGVGARFNGAGQAAAGGASQYGAAAQDGYGGYGTEGHEKGHSTKGFHKSYHNVESGKNTKFIDEDHDVANQKYGQARDAAYGNKGWDVRGKGHGQGIFAEHVSQDAGARDALRSGGAHQANYGAHDVNGYYHNQDLAHKRGREFAEDNQLVRRGLHGIRANTGGVIHNGDLW